MGVLESLITHGAPLGGSFFFFSFINMTLYCCCIHTQALHIVYDSSEGCEVSCFFVLCHVCISLKLKDGYPSVVGLIVLMKVECR